MTHRCAAAALAVSVVLCLAGCGGGDIGGTVSGLGADRSVKLDNNGSDSLVVIKNGAFMFAKTVAPNKAYAVSVVSHPVGQSCTVADGSGTVDAEGDSVDSVRVTCVDEPKLIGTLVGLAAGTSLTLVDGATGELTLTDNGPFAFPAAVADGTAYEVAVSRQPFVGLCIVTNGSGSFDAKVPTAIVVTCG